MNSIKLVLVVSKVKTNDSTSRNVHAIPILRGGMHNNSQKQYYSIRVTILHGEEWNPTLHWGQQGKTANLGEEYESETITSGRCISIVVTY
jgi:hypothetical protein